jgi:phage shock protein PspC (stress-responsive transcriptional regulator)
MTCPYCRTENEPGAVRCRACTSWIAEPVPQREWLRARQGKMIAGVCRGLSNRFGVPLAVTRLVFVLSVLFGGWGVLLYLALWIAMPLEPAAAAPAARPAPPPPVPTPSPQPPANLERGAA